MDNINSPLKIKNLVDDIKNSLKVKPDSDVKDTGKNLQPALFRLIK